MTRFKHPKDAQQYSRRSVLQSGAGLGAGALASSIFPRIAAAQRKPDPLTIGMAVSTMTITYPAITNAQQFGYFEEEGIDCRVVTGQGSSQILSVLIGGTVDICVSNPEPVIQLVSGKSTPIKSLYKIHNGGYSFAVKPESPITDIKDLKGKKLGMFSPQSGIDYVKARLADVGMTVNDIVIVPTGFGAQAILAAQKGQVDAMLYWADAFQIFRNAGLVLRELSKASWEHGLYASVISATETVIKSKADILARSCRAMAKGQLAAVLDPEKSVAAFYRKYPEQAPKGGTQDKAYQNSISLLRNHISRTGSPGIESKTELFRYQWGEQSADIWKRIQEYLYRTGTIAKVLDVNSYFTNQFIERANDFDREKLSKSLSGKA